MFLKVRSVLLMATIAALGVAAAQAQAIAPSKVAIINAQKAVADTQEIKKAQAALQAKYQPRQQAIDTLQRDLQSIQQQLSTPNLAADRAAQLRLDGTHKQREVQRLARICRPMLITSDKIFLVARAGK